MIKVFQTMEPDPGFTDQVKNSLELGKLSRKLSVYKLS